MTRALGVVCGATLFLICAHRLPAPILEEETPTPAPEQPATLKPKPTLKPKIATESSEDSAKQQTSSPIPTNQITSTKAETAAHSKKGPVHPVVKPGAGLKAEPPIALDCTIRHWNDAFRKEKEHDYYTGYSTTKVAPKDIAWLRPGANPVGRPNQQGRTLGFIVLGSCKKGNLTGSTDIQNLMVKLSKLAADHGANAINYELSGTELRVQFLRIQDAILSAARRR
jgi:hypothetical protein